MRIQTEKRQEKTKTRRMVDEVKNTLPCSLKKTSDETDKPNGNTESNASES